MVRLSKKIFISFVAASIMILSVSFSAFATTGYSLLVNGLLIKGEAKLINGITYVPMRSVIEVLGGTYHVMPDLNRISMLGKDLSLYGGHNMANPLDLGSTAHIAVNRGNEKFIAEISIDGIRTGRDSWKYFEQVKEPPPKGYVFHFVKLNFKVLSVEKPGTEVVLNFYEFNYLDSKSQEKMVSIPTIQDRIQLVEGETFDDWIGFLVKEDEPIKTIYFSKSGNETDAIWMKV